MIRTVVIDGHGIRELEDLRRDQYGTLTRYFVEALRAYALMAGFVDKNTASDWNRRRRS